MSKARIYSPPKSAMQSVQARTQGWVLRHVSDQPKRIDPLMGWTGSADTEQQVVLHFDTLEEAEDYARANGIRCRGPASGPGHEAQVLCGQFPLGSQAELDPLIAAGRFSPR